MAGDWIKMRTDLFTHPKVFRLAETLGENELYVVGALLAFWSWADRHAVDGRVDGAASHQIDKAVRVDGLAAALIAVGWLEVDARGACIPRYEEHNGESAKERSLKNQRQARWRERKSSDSVGGVASTRPSTTPSTEASTREEKRREENKEQKQEQKTTAQPTAARPVIPPELAELSDSLAADFKALRKAKRAPITQTAMDGIRREAAKAGLTFTAAVQVCCERGWAAFKADWYEPERRSGATPLGKVASAIVRLEAMKSGNQRARLDSGPDDAADVPWVGGTASG